jgi:ATP synthase subunit 6
MFVYTPLEQFQIISLLSIKFGWLNLSFTNSALFMLIPCVVIYLLVVLGTIKPIVTTRENPGSSAWQGIVELIYEFVLTMVLENIGEKGLKYFPFVFTTFMFILVCNLIGMVPYTFTATSHLIVTFGLAFTIWVGVTIIGFSIHKIHFFSFFFPPGAPIALAPLLVVIEIISYVFRALSLSIRLFANMMAGHTLFKIVSGFGWLMFGTAFWWAGFFPIVLLFGFTGLELGVAALQAYVFTVLTCIYLNDSIHLH